MASSVFKEITLLYVPFMSKFYKFSLKDWKSRSHLLNFLDSF